jgi:hypothetical protein
MTDLVTWLRAQLDEDEAVAGSATSGPWNNDDAMSRDGVYAPAVDTWVADCRFEQMGPFALDNATHIARWDPARILAEVEAKRRILAMGDDFEIYSEPYTSQTTWERIVALMAGAYADRSGYREEWRP